MAAIVFLRIVRSFSWTSDTIEGILALGYQIYDDNLSYVEDRDVYPTDIKNKIKLGKSSYTIVAEQIVFGQLSSNSDYILNLKNGLYEFFVNCDAGIIHGPQSVAIWQELGYFYMFDAKERDKFGRKWFQQLTNPETVGCACVCRFENLTDLAHIFLETIPLKHRHDNFRITRIDVNDYVVRSDDWHNWKGIALNKWILRGNLSQSNERFSEESRNYQGTSISAIALLFRKLFNVQEWNVEIIDDIMITGDEYYKQSVEALKKENLLINPELQVAELMRNFVCQDKKINFIFDDCLINGSLVISGDLQSGIFRISY